MPEAGIERASLSSREIYEPKVTEYLDQLSEIIENPGEEDPALVPLATQIANGLKHASYSFRIAGDSDDFPYRLRVEEPYQKNASVRATTRSLKFFNLKKYDGELPSLEPFKFGDDYREQAQQEQDKIVREMIADPVGAYKALAERRKDSDREANFPEFSSTLKTLYFDVATDDAVLAACEASPMLSKMRHSLLLNLQGRFKQNYFGYTSTLEQIDDSVSFLDAVVRVNEPDSPAPYHTARFEYNWDSLIEEEEAILFPTTAVFNSEDLIRLRSVPIGVAGVTSKTLTVDGFPQTPREMFHHDIDHFRREFEATMAAVEREGITLDQYCEEANDLIVNILVPTFDLTDVVDEDELDRRTTKRMELFEILHEDAMDPSRDTIAEAILRAPMERTPFERMVDADIVEYYMAPRATTLAHVYRKLAHTFYDLPEKRSKSLGSDFVRTRLLISQSAAELYRLVSDDPIDENDLLATCRDLVSTDEGFTDAFMGNLAHDIARRGIGENALRLMIARPLGVASAVRTTRSFRPKVHSLFGYSGLEYEDPDRLAETVAKDLESFDPEETAIAIGATPYGIGHLYHVVKDLGFFTLGIVASTALGLNENSADGVDKIVIVKDNGWGGFRYSQETSGLLSPTTRVFVGASDSIAAYGGGDITAVTLEEARRRNKPISFTPFDMNHRIADMLAAQKGKTESPDYRGPAYTKWHDLGA